MATSDITASRRSPRKHFITSGQRFSRFIALTVDDCATRPTKWICVCDCGRFLLVSHDNLVSGKSKSCGCWKLEKSRERARTHGMYGTREYGIWRAMISRCTNARQKYYDLYGGRGITVCDRWRNFAAFYADMGPRPTPKHSIDRIDNNGPYSPENCRWSTRYEQAQNTRTNVYVSLNGKIVAVAEAARQIGLDAETLRMRLKRGDMGERLFRPVRGATSRPTRQQSQPPIL